MIPAFALTSALYANTGWAGYAWPSANTASSELKVPSLSAPDGSEAFWAGLGKGDPGIQQCGITATRRNGAVWYTAWYEMWPAPAHAYGQGIKAGDEVRFTVSRSDVHYALTVQDLTRHWSARTVQSYGHHEYQAEAITEEFGQPASGFSPAWFHGTSGNLASLYSWPSGGEHAVRNGSTSFTIHRT